MIEKILYDLWFKKLLFMIKKNILIIDTAASTFYVNIVLKAAVFLLYVKEIEDVFI